MRNRPMEDYLERVHQENERLRKENVELVALATDLSDRIHEKDAILHHSAVAATAARNRINDLEAKLEAVRDRCEGNNWMGTARLCGSKERTFKEIADHLMVKYDSVWRELAKR